MHFVLAQNIQDASFNLPHVLSPILILACWISFFKYRTYFRYVFIGTIILGLLGIHNPNGYEVSNVLTISHFSFSYQPPFLLISVILFFTNLRKVFYDVLNAFAPEKAKQQEITTNIKKERIARIKQKHLGKSKAELLKIVNDNRYTEESRMIANQLLDEHSTNLE